MAAQPIGRIPDCRPAFCPSVVSIYTLIKSDLWSYMVMPVLVGFRQVFVRVGASATRVPSWGPRLSEHAPTPVPSKAAFPLGLSLTPHMFLCGPQSFKSSPAPAWVAHRSQYLLWHRAPPSKSAFPACLQQ